MLFNNPIGSEKASRVIQLLELPPESRVLDVGCGRGEFLLQVAAEHAASGWGIDRDAGCIAAAEQTAAARGLASRCEFRVADAAEWTAAPGEFALGICLGSTHAFGAGEAPYPNTIDRLSQLVRPGGNVLIGEGYWKQEPTAEYLQFLGEPVGIYRDHAGNIAFAEQRGLIPLYATVSNDDEWDDFEWRHQLRIRREAEANPSDLAATDRLLRSQRWRDGYLRWGRSTMGFGLYLFRVPPRS